MSTEKRPHVVLFICDQLRADALGFMQNEHVNTPNLDRLAQAGVTFDNLYCQTPVCMGSRASLLTGRYLRTLRMGNGSSLLPPQEETLAETLQREGYRTGMFGKLHLTPQEYTSRTLGSDKPIADAAPFCEAAGLPIPTDPLKKNYGFQDCVEFEDILKGNYFEWLEQKNPATAERITKAYQEKLDGTYYQRLREQDPTLAESAIAPSLPLKNTLNDVYTVDVPAELHASSYIAESAANYFTENHQDNPCFIHVSFVDPHHPFDPPKEIAAKYDPAQMPAPKYRDTGELEWPEGLLAGNRMADGTNNFADVSEEEARITIANYYAMIEMIDRGVGQMIEAIEAAGEWENTIFAFVADHGEFLGDYGLWRKGSHHYDCLLRVPGFITWPGKTPAGRRVEGLVEMVDYAPTLHDLIGIEQNEGHQGVSMADAILNDKPIGKRWAFTEMYRAQWGPFYECWTLRTESAKLNYYPTDRIGHLFDLTADPDERNNLFDDPAHRELRDEMMGNMLEAVYEQFDPLPRVLSQY